MQRTPIFKFPVSDVGCVYTYYIYTYLLQQCTCLHSLLFIIVSCNSMNLYSPHYHKGSLVASFCIYCGKYSIFSFETVSFCMKLQSIARFDSFPTLNDSCSWLLVVLLLVQVENNIKICYFYEGLSVVI